MRELYFSTVLERFALLELSPSVKWTACGKRSGTSTEEKLLKEPVVLIAAVCTWISPIVSVRRSERAKKVCWRQAGSCYRRKAIWWWSSICCSPCTASAGSSLKVRALQTLRQPMRCFAIWGLIIITHHVGKALCSGMVMICISIISPKGLEWVCWQFAVSHHCSEEIVHVCPALIQNLITDKPAHTAELEPRFYGLPVKMCYR